MEQSGKNAINTRSKKALENQPKPKGRRVVEIIEESENESSEDEEEIPVKKTRNKKNTEKAKPLLSREDEEVDPVPRHKQLPYLNIPDLNDPREKAEVKIDSFEPILDTEKRPVSYKHQAPIENLTHEKEALASLYNAPVTLTAETLISISPSIRQDLIRALSKKRMPVQMAQNRKVTMVDELDIDGVPIKPVTLQLEADAIPISELNIKTAFTITTKDEGNIPKGSIVFNDPVAQYLQELDPSEKPKQIYVAKESHALRTVFPIINKMGQIESLLDGGSQIIAMDVEVAKKLAISWDPDIKIQMQSANRTIEQTLGLARNVPFVFGNITVYLQVHIITDPAYKVLLGRPFDVLTESVVHNYKDGGQTLVIADPNSRQRCVLPTYERGKPPTILKTEFPREEKDFRSSMI